MDVTSHFSSCDKIKDAVQLTNRVLYVVQCTGTYSVGVLCFAFGSHPESIVMWRQPDSSVPIYFSNLNLPFRNLTIVF